MLGQAAGAAGSLIMSDKNVKTNIKPSTTLEQLMKKVRPVTYDYKDNPEAPPRAGVLAQDLEKTPLANSVVDTPAGKALDTEQLTPQILSMLIEMAHKVYSKGSK